MYQHTMGIVEVGWRLVNRWMSRLMTQGLTTRLTERLMRRGLVSR